MTSRLPLGQKTALLEIETRPKPAAKSWLYIPYLTTFNVTLLPQTVHPHNELIIAAGFGE